MTKYVIDTDVLINAAKNREPDRTWLLTKVRDGDQLGLCAITLAEFYSGIRRGTQPPFDEFLDKLPIVVITPQMAITAGSYRFEFARQGTTLATTDCLIAAVAHHTGATLVTHNTRYYPMGDVTVVSLRGSGEFGGERGGP